MKLDINNGGDIRYQHKKAYAARRRLCANIYYMERGERHSHSYSSATAEHKGADWLYSSFSTEASNYRDRSPATAAEQFFAGFAVVVGVAGVQKEGFYWLVAGFVPLWRSWSFVK